MELDWAYSEILNQYIRTGEEQLIMSLDSWTYPNSGNNQECVEFYRALYEWNRSMPDERKIRIWGTDVAHGKTATVSRILEGLRNLPDCNVAEELAAVLRETVQPERKYASIKRFEQVFLEKTRPFAESTRDYEKTALYVRVLKDTAAWKELEKDSSIAADYPGVQEIREEASLAMWQYILDRHDFDRDGKILFHGGSWHTVLGVKEGITRRLGVLLNETVPKVAGRVCTINAVTVSGLVRMKDGTHKDARALLGESPMWAEFSGLPYRWSLSINNEGVFYPDGTLYSAHILLKDCTPARSRPINSSS